MDQHKIWQKKSTHNKSIEGEISSEGVPFAIDVKGGEKEKENDDRGSMSIAINDKGEDCSMRVSRSSKEKQIIINMKENSSKRPDMKH